MSAIAGNATINFTRLQLGNGTGQDSDSAQALNNPIMTDIKFSEIKASDSYVTLSSSFSNKELTVGFNVTEIGVFACDSSDDNSSEILYAIAYEPENSADYIPDKNDRIVDLQYDLIMYIGSAKNVAADIGSSLVYVSKADFTAHSENIKNPHSVTAAQVGLGNVPNVSTNDQTPTFSETNTLQSLTSGAKLSDLFGRIAKAITELINHIKNKNNPHTVTAEQCGAAKAKHMHSAADINTGTLSVLRGGTGVQNYKDLSHNLPTEFNSVNITDMDCNDLIGSFIVGYGNGVLNKPNDAGNGYLINVSHSTDSLNYNKQLWLNRADNKFFTRLRENGVWSDWVNVFANTENIQNKVSSLDSNPTDEQYPTAKLLKTLTDLLLNKSAKNITDGNCNEFIGELIFAYGNNVANKPTTATNGYLINIPHSIQPTLYNKQFWLNRTDIKMFVRAMENGEWSEWSDLTYGTSDISLKEDKSNKINTVIDSNNEFIELTENQYLSGKAIEEFVTLKNISMTIDYEDADKNRLLILSEIPSGAVSLASAYNKGPIFMYTGASTGTYTKGKIYEVVKSGLTYSISEVT